MHTTTLRGLGRIYWEYTVQTTEKYTGFLRRDHWYHGTKRGNFSPRLLN